MTSIALNAETGFSPPASATTGAFQEAKPDPLALMLAIMVPLSAGFWVAIGWVTVRVLRSFLG